MDVASVVEENDHYLPVATLVVGVALAIGRFGHTQFGNAEPDPDFARVFLPMATEIANGAVPYSVGMADNKPPGWIFLNVGAVETGSPLLVMLLVVGLAHGITAALLYRWLANRDLVAAGLLACILYLLTLQLVHGMWVTERAVAMVFVVGALVAARAHVRGLLVGVAGLMTAYAGLAVPFVGWLVYERSTSEWRDVATFLLGGAGVAAVVFGTVAVVWGHAVAASALHWSYGLPLLVDYETSRFATFIPPPGSYLAQAWPLTMPFRWIAYIGLYASRLLPLLVLAGLGVRRWWVEPDRHGRTVRILVAGALLMSVPLVVRSFAQYWLLPLPFLAMLGGLGGVNLLERTLSANDGTSRTTETNA